MKFQAKIPLENILKPQLDLDPEVNDPYTNVLRPWNGRGRRNDKLTDAPLITSLLPSTISPDYHFC